MKIPNESSSKDAMLLYLLRKGERTIRHVAKSLNCHPLVEYEISETAQLNDVLSDMKLVSRPVLWSELIKACPELIDESDGEEDSEQDYEEDDDCEDGEVDDDEEYDEEIDDEDDE